MVTGARGSTEGRAGHPAFFKYGELAVLALLACGILFLAGWLPPAVSNLMAYLRVAGGEEAMARQLQLRAIAFMALLLGTLCGVFFFWVLRLALHLARARLVPKPRGGGGIEAIARELALSREAMKVWNRELERAVRERTRELEEANAQLAQTWERLLQAERLASLGQMAAGIAHEMRNPLGIINTSAYYLKGAVTSDDAVEQLSIIEREVARMEKTISSLLGFARLSASYEPVLTDIGEVAASAVEAVRAEGLPEGTQVNLEVCGAVEPVLVDREQMRRVFINLIRNGLESLKGPGRVDVRVSSAHGMVSVAVTDTGEGIPPERRAHIFEPFYSTKPVGQGAGLGLAMAKAIVSRAGGSIEVESEPGRGSTFTVLLPPASDVQ